MVECFATKKGIITEIDTKRIINHLEDYQGFIRNFKQEPDKTTLLKLVEQDIAKLNSLF